MTHDEAAAMTMASCMADPRAADAAMVLPIDLMFSALQIVAFHGQERAIGFDCEDILAAHPDPDTTALAMIDAVAIAGPCTVIVGEPEKATCLRDPTWRALARLAVNDVGGPSKTGPYRYFEGFKRGIDGAYRLLVGI